jgi:hypothetical protein
VSSSVCILHLDYEVTRNDLPRTSSNSLSPCSQLFTISSLVHFLSGFSVHIHKYKVHSLSLSSLHMHTHRAIYSFTEMAHVLHTALQPAFITCQYVEGVIPCHCKCKCFFSTVTQYFILMTCYLGNWSCINKQLIPTFHWCDYCGKALCAWLCVLV